MSLRLRIDGASVAPQSAERAADFDATVQQLNSLKTIEPQNLSSGKTLVNSINEGIADQAQQAAAAILDLREQEVSLLEDSKNRAYGDQTISRQTQAATIETEIARVATSASYNGINPLSGGTLTTDDSGSNVHNAIGLASFSSVLTTGASFSNQTPSNATSDLETVKDNVISVTSLLGSYTGDLQKAQELSTPKTMGFESFNNGTLRDGEEAQNIAKKIAASVVSPYATERQKLSLIQMSADNLNADKVYRLIA